MSQNSYEQLDELLAQFRLGVARVRQSDPAAADELKALLTQLEYWVESLVIDSLRLKDMESKAGKLVKPPGRLGKRPGKKQG